MKIKLFSVALLAGASLLSACKKDEKDNTSENTAKALTTYATVAQAMYDDSYTMAQALQSKINTFANFPTQANLDICKDAWRAAREPYGQTEGLRFYGGPIDDETPGQEGPEGLINAWPLDEFNIDYVDTNGVRILDTVSIIARADRYGAINKDSLVAWSEKDGDEKYVTTGYHAIEFLLWGQDAPTNIGAGQRPLTDFTTDPKAARRLEYLKACADLLVEHLDQVRKQWAPNGAYRTSFVAGGNASVTKALEGIGKLANFELADERMFVAMQNNDQEDEHSCFSDNTHRDIQGNFHSVRNLYLGSYTRVGNLGTVSGYSISDLVKSKNAARDEQMREALTSTQTLIDKIDPPFDRAILNDKPDIQAAVDALHDLGDDLVNAAQALGLSINING